MLIFLRSSELAIDSKLQRYSRALTQAKIAHAAIYWKRAPETLPPSQLVTIPYDAPLEYKSRKMTARRLLGLNFFALSEIWRRRQSVSVIHAIDLDTAPAAWLASLLTGIPFIYDIYDHYPDSRGLTGFARKALGWLERMIMRRAALVILADPSRLSQHDGIPQVRLMVIENVPDLSRADLPQCPPPSLGQGAPLRIGYLGTLEPTCRGIEHMLEVVKAMPQVELEIAGAGALEDQVKAAAARCSRIRFHGAMAYNQGLALMQSCHVLMGLYYTCNPNHRFAAPNKYFEHLLIGRAMLTSQGTPPGDKVERHSTGWAVADSAAAIRAALEQACADPDLLTERSVNARQLWQSHFAHYARDTIQGTYVDAIHNISVAPRVPRDLAIVQALACFPGIA